MSALMNMVGLKIHWSIVTEKDVMWQYIKVGKYEFFRLYYLTEIDVFGIYL